MKNRIDTDIYSIMSTLYTYMCIIMCAFIENYNSRLNGTIILLCISIIFGICLEKYIYKKEKTNNAKHVKLKVMISGAASYLGFAPMLLLWVFTGLSLSGCTFTIEVNIFIIIVVSILFFGLLIRGGLSAVDKSK